MKRQVAVTLALVQLLSFGLSPLRAETLDRLVDAFVEITDKTEHKFEIGTNISGVTKWSIPIRFNVIGATSQDTIKEVEAQMNRLARLSRLEIRRVPGFVLNAKGERESIDDVHVLGDAFEFASMREDALQRGHLVNALVDGRGPTRRGWLGNFSIIFGKRQLLERIFDHLHFAPGIRDQFARSQIVCFSTILIPKGSRDPRLAIVLIPTDQDDWLIRRCLVEETTQSLGLIGDIPGSTLTLFDDRPDRKRIELTAYDEIFLRVLYSPEIQLGMSGQALRKTARRLIEVELSKLR